MHPFVFTTIAFFALLALLWAIYRGNKTIHYVAKPLASSMFIAVCLCKGFGSVYTQRIALALFACMVGDMCLMFRGSRYFMGGLLAFLAGHLAYIWAFQAVPGWNFAAFPWWLTTVVWAISLILFGLLGIHKLPIQVSVYCLVITLMLWCAWGIFRQIEGGWLLASGATCFYVSDLFVALNKFVHERFLNRLLGLPLYYTGQFLLAFSALQIS